MLPADWPVLIVDLKDCFFTIPLHPDDRPKFAFTINNAKPTQRYQWKVLPQGMRNLPVLCQWYVARALSGVRKQFPDAHVYHYMDDILVAAPIQDELLRIQPQLLNALHSHGLQVAPEKVYRIEPSIDVTVFITTPDLHPTGDLSSANEQIRLLSKSVLDKICNAAEKTFYQIPSPEIKTSYVNIKQFPSENFLQFVDRLRSQVERQVQDPVVQAELIKEMAQRNANETCRRIILSLPLDPSPSLAQMIEACTTRAELFSAPERNPGLTHPKPVAAAAPGARRQLMSSDQLQHIICHHCKRPGHFAKACPENQKRKSKNQKN
ncbi:hypothetical protein DUI87_03215 [Hirundo rustica rustica]|uniref:ribonuclease H n=1 Tax=Hirundo rustica rustica TaxID=333673 RepID=A0A3M0L6R5_HIRRU|nr:hypothetical protein DUI87_03215 [Hirundo rustica rustica]